MTEALEEAKRAKKKGVDVAQYRKDLKRARVAWDAHDYDTAMGWANEILRSLGVLHHPEEPSPAMLPLPE
jgi:hypothetical protein